MELKPTHIPDVLLIQPKVHGDERGFLMETYREDTLLDAGVRVNFVQDNHSRSARGVLRGLHYQIGRPQAKLVRVTRGAVLDVAVDIRRSSPTFVGSVMLAKLLCFTDGNAPLSAATGSWSARCVATA